jgi:hypothetical protein
MEKVGQIFDVTKCLVFGNSLALSEVDHPHLQKSTVGLIILGCPYGTTSFMHHSLSLLLQNLEIECGYLKSINNPLSAYNILKYCLNTKGTYLARVCTPALLCDHTVSFDRCIDHIIASWADINFLPELSSDIRSLPYGLNIPKLGGISIPAWTNSFSSALQLSHNLKSNHFNWCITHGESYLNDYAQTCKLFMPNFNFHNNTAIPSQKDNTLSYYNRLTLAIREKLKGEKNLLSYFICMGRDPSCMPLWMGWLKFKNFFKYYDFSNSSFQHSLRLRLLIHKFVAWNVECSCRNNGNLKVVNSDSEYSLKKFSNMFHCLSCDSTAAIIKIRHDKLSSVIQNFVLRFCDGAVSQIEEKYHCRFNGEKKAVDVTITLRDITYYIDVSIFNPGCKSHVRLKDESCLDLMKAQEVKKRLQYQDVFLDGNPNLIPFIIDTAGNLGPEASKFIAVLRRHRNKHIMDSKFEKAFLTAISICLGNGLSATNEAFFEILEQKIGCLDTQNISILV